MFANYYIYSIVSIRAQYARPIEYIRVLPQKIVGILST